MIPRVICIFIIPFLLTHSATPQSPSESTQPTPTEQLIEDENWLKVHNWDNWLSTDCLFSNDELVNPDSSVPSFNYLFSPEEFDDLDLAAFREALKENSRMPIFKFQNSRNIIICIISSILTGILFFLFLYHLGCVSRHKKIKVSKSVYICLVISLCIFIFIVVVSYIVLVILGLKAKKVESKILCEALRVPLTLMRGNADVTTVAKHDAHFIGLRTFRNWISSFLNDYHSYVSGDNHDVLQLLGDIHFERHVDILKTSVIDFVKKFRNKTVTNFEGVETVPNTLSSGLTHYQELMDALVVQYSEHAERINGLNDIFDFVKDANAKERFRNNLEMAEMQLIEMEIKFLKFWQDMLNTVLISPGTQKTDVDVILWINAIFISVVLFSFIIYIFTYCKKQVKNPLIFRGVLLGSCLFAITSMVLSIEILRGVYSTHYGCAFLDQIINGDTSLVSDLEQDFGASKETQLIFNTCYLNPDSSSHNIYSLVSDSDHQTAMMGYLEFLDGLKTISDDKQAINHLTDEYATVQFGNRLEEMKLGLRLEFSNLEAELDKLNVMFQCTDMFYSWSEDTCKKAAYPKPNCVVISDQTYVFHECVADDVSARDIFIRLQDYILSEKNLMSEMINDLIPVSNTASVMHNLEEVWRKNNFIYEKVKLLQDSLNAPFESLDDGELKNWLDCTAIKSDLEFIYEDVCLKDLGYGVKFADLASTIAILLFFILTFNFLITILDFKGDPSRLDSSGYMFNDSSRMKKEIDRNFEKDRVKDKKEGFASQENEKFVDPNLNETGNNQDFSDEELYIPQKSINIQYKRNVISTQRNDAVGNDFLNFEVDKIDKSNPF